MRIGIDGLAARMGGGAVYLTNQLKALARNAPEWEFILFCVPQNHADISVQSPNIETILVRSAGRSLTNRILWQQFFLPLELRQRQIDLLYCPGNFCLLWAPCPQVLTLQNPNHFANLSYQSTLTLKVKRLLQHFGSVKSIQWADYTVFISQDYRRHVERHMALNGIDWDVIYSGVDDIFRDREQQPRKITYRVPSNYILAVSNFYRHKNYETLLRAFELISDRRKDELLHLVVAGGVSDKTYFQEVMQLLSQLRAKDKIHLLGPVKHNCLPELYANARCYVSTSILEAFPLTPFEAMSSSVPVVISQATVFPEICGVAAIYFDPLNVEDVADKIELVLNNPAVAKGLIQKGFERAAEFTWDSNAQRLIKIFDRVTHS